MSQNFTTGAATLPDFGELSYNGCRFSSLFTSKISGKQILDDAKRTIKWTEYSLHVTGYVTAPDGVFVTDIGLTMTNLRTLLSKAAGQLIYTGRGFGQNFIVNPPGAGGTRDCNWGPHPEVLDFQPLGNAKSALVEFKVTFCIFEARATGRLVQMNSEVSLSYDEDAYSRWTLKGTMEIAMTRLTVDDRTVTQTVDDYRQQFLQIVTEDMLLRYKVTQREFNVSRDMRVMEWSLVLEEQAPMGGAPGATKARGSFTCRPFKVGMEMGGGIRWIMSLRCTYTIRKDLPRRLAWANFLGLLQYRMRQSAFSDIPLIANPQPPNPNPPAPIPLVDIVDPITGALLDIFRRLPRPNPLPDARAMMWGFGFDEGLHDDSRTVTFEASWLLITSLSALLRASGIWRWVGGYVGGQLWATSVQPVSDWKGNLVNNFTPQAIVDLNFPTN